MQPDLPCWLGMGHPIIGMFPATGFQADEGAGQNWGGRRGRGSDEEVIKKPAKKVGLPVVGARIGEQITAEMGDGPPAIVLALPAVQEGTQIDWGSGESNSTQESMPSPAERSRIGWIIEFFMTQTMTKPRAKISFRGTEDESSGFLADQRISRFFRRFVLLREGQAP